MGIFDWLHSSDSEEAEPPGMSRRAFFARFAGQGIPGEEAEEDRDDTRPGSICTFFVHRFRYHDGPVLVPMLRTDLDFQLTRDIFNPIDPQAIKIQWGRDHLGYVVPEHMEEIKRRLKEGEVLLCRSIFVDPTADLDQVLKVEIYHPENEPDPEADAEGDEDTAEDDTEGVDGAAVDTGETGSERSTGA